MLVACGDEPTSNAAKAGNGAGGGETSATGASGKGSGKSSDKNGGSNDSSGKNGSKSDDDSSSKSSGDSKTKSGGGSSKSGGGSNSATEEPNGTRQTKPSADTEDQVKDATLKMESAIKSKDVDYLCGEAYSKEYLETLAAAGGCQKKLTAQVERYESYDLTITAVNFLSPVDAQVYLKLRFTLDGKETKSEPAISFKLEGGKWLYYIRTAD